MWYPWETYPTSAPTVVMGTNTVSKGRQMSPLPLPLASGSQLTTHNSQCTKPRKSGPPALHYGEPALPSTTINKISTKKKKKDFYFYINYGFFK